MIGDTGVSEAKPDESGLQNQNEALRERLRSIANHYNQSELARRTRVSKANVHRYLKSGRIPADWLQSILVEFKINPSWLMLGRGEMLQTDVSSEAAQESAQILELAVKLNAVDHERLSALQGRERTKMVRELSDTLARHDELRSRLRERVKPVADKLIREYSNLTREQRHDETEEVLAALRQLDRIQDDWEFRALLDGLEAIQCTFRGEYQRAVELTHRIIGTRIAAGELRGPSTMRATVNAATGLVAQGRLREASALASAVMALAGGDDLPTEEFRALQVPQALFDLDDGRPLEGFAKLTQLAARIPATLENFVKDLYLTAGYYVGVTSLPVALDTYSGNPYYTGTLMLMALWECDIAVLGRVQAIMEKGIQRPDASSEHRKLFLDAVIEGKIPAEREASNGFEAFQDAVLRCEAARIAGRRGIAKKAFGAAQEAVKQLDPSCTPRFLVRAMHSRQAFDYGDAKATGEWVLARLHEGYGRLRSLAKEHELLEQGPPPRA